MTGSYESFFCFASHMSLYLPVNVSLVVCDSILFEIKFEIFLPEKL